MSGILVSQFFFFFLLCLPLPWSDRDILGPGVRSPLFTPRFFHIPGAGMSPEEPLPDRSPNLVTIPLQADGKVQSCTLQSVRSMGRPPIFLPLHFRRGVGGYHPRASVHILLQWLLPSLSHSWHRPGTWFSLPSLPVVAGPPRLSVPRLARLPQAAGAGRLRFLYSV